MDSETIVQKYIAQMTIVDVEPKHNYFDGLPDEIVVKICECVGLPNYANVQLVCTRLYRIVTPIKIRTESHIRTAIDARSMDNLDAELLALKQLLLIENSFNYRQLLMIKSAIDRKLSIGSNADRRQLCADVLELCTRIEYAHVADVGWMEQFDSLVHFLFVHASEIDNQSTNVCLCLKSFYRPFINHLSVNYSNRLRLMIAENFMRLCHWYKSHLDDDIWSIIEMIVDDDNRIQIQDDHSCINLKRTIDYIYRMLKQYVNSH